MRPQTLLAAILLAASGSFALAGGNSDGTTLSGKAMQDLPGNQGPGTTPKTEGNSDETSLSGKAMKDLPGNR